MLEQWSAWHGCVEPRAKRFSQLLTQAWEGTFSLPRARTGEKTTFQLAGALSFTSKSPSVQSNFFPHRVFFPPVAGILTFLSEDFFITLPSLWLSV